MSRQLPSWVWDVDDDEIIGLFQEVYAALQADSRRLALMGCRAIVDLIMVAQLGDDKGGFEQKLNMLVEKSLISRPDGEVLGQAIEAGSAAAHRGYRPSPESLELVVSIVEHLARSIQLRDAAPELDRTTPKRGRQD